MRKLHFVYVCVFLALLATSGFAQDALKFENNFFVTGDYVVGGVGLAGTGQGGFATGTISIPGTAPNTYISPGISGTNSVPAGAQIVAAFLYWETVEASQAPGSGKNGFFRPLVANGPSTGYSITGVPLVSSGTNGPVAWSQGGCAGGSNGTKTMQPYRADVLGLLAQDANGNVQANVSYEVQLPDSGSNGSAPLTLGATLVLVYRVLSPSFPLNAVVIYDGAFSPTNGSAPMSQSIEGFYQPKTISPFARLTHIVGNGQSNKYEQVLFGNGTPTALNAPGTAPFFGFYGGSWDNPTWNVSTLINSALPSFDTAETTQVVPNSNQGGCVSWGAVIFSTTVQSSDGDGLLDVWKQNGGYRDVGTGQPVDLPGVHQPGATPPNKDVFIQLDYMVNGSQPSFAPNANALTMVQNALQAHHIYLHYGTGHEIDEASGGPAQACTDIPASGGTPAQYCAYPGQPGVVIWTPGFLFLKTQPLGGLTEAQCEQNPSACVRRFNPALKDSYHYVLFGDRLGAPNWDFVSQTVTAVSQSGNTVTFSTSVPHGLAVNSNLGNGRVTVYGAISNPFLNGTYLVTSVTCPKNPVTKTANDCSRSNTAPGPYKFTVNVGGSSKSANYSRFTDPNLAIATGLAGTSSGVSDVGGSNSVITLGGWGADGTTDAVQAGTFMHELGHAFGLTHGGFYFDKLAAGNNDYTPTIEANCKPNLQSVMNYLFQVDLLDKPTQDANGNPVVASVPDYSGQQLVPLSEDSLLGVMALTSIDVPPQPTSYLNTQWYALTAQNGVGTPANSHCDGTPLVTSDPDHPMYRWTGPTASLPWSISNYLDPNGKLDINFDGKFEVLSIPAPPYGLRGYNDWNNVDARQVGATGSLTVAGGGGFVNGGGGFVNGGGGFVNGGGGFVNGGGGFVNGGGGFVNGGGGFVNGGGGFVNGGAGEFTYDAANSVTHPPKNLAATVIATPAPRYIQLTWDKPFGQIASYNIYRSDNGGDFVKKFSVPGTSDTTIAYNDKTVTCPNTYSYFVTAVLAGTDPPQESSQSNTAPGAPVSVCAPPYDFTGFLTPLSLASDSSYSGTFLVGNTIPVLWTLQLQADSSYVSNPDVNTLQAIGPVPLVGGACPLPGSVPVFFNHSGTYPYAVSSLYSLGTTAQGSTFTFNTSNNQFTYSWGTNSLAAGCYVIELDLDSGQVERTALKVAAPYKFTGFYSPLATADPPNTGSYSGTASATKSITAKWTLQTSSGTIITNTNVNTLVAVGPFATLSDGSCRTTQVNIYASCSLNNSCTVPGKVLLSPTTTKGNSSLKFSSGQFVFNWDTKVTPPATGKPCYVLELDLDNGQVERTGIKLQ